MSPGITNPEPMGKVGIKDIAAETGVSIATVSHALRNPERVSDETRKKVLAAVSAELER